MHMSDSNAHVLNTNLSKIDFLNKFSIIICYFHITLSDSSISLFSLWFQTETAEKSSENDQF